MKICILTQTAEDISDCYKSFFKDFDIYFVTFKTYNPKAIDFLPKSSWSEGRNRLWEGVKGKYDYYLFIDDDLIFYKAQFDSIPFLQRVSQKYNKTDITKAYKRCSSKFFFQKLNKWIANYKPEVLTVKSLNNLGTHNLDANILSYKKYIRRVGWFDAQFTVFSAYAEQCLLSFDTKVSCLAIAQILIYLLSYNVFKNKAVSVLDIAVDNTFHIGAYVEDYKSNLDCLNMIEHICKFTNIDKKQLFDFKTNHVNLFYGKEHIFDNVISGKDNYDYQLNFDNSYISNIKHFMLENNLIF